jgi:cell volume regulation protein A
MATTEPTQSAPLLAAVGVLMAVSVLFSRPATRTGIPVALFFLLVGMLAAVPGLGARVHAGYTVIFRLGTVALVLIRPEDRAFVSLMFGRPEEA